MLFATASEAEQQNEALPSSSTEKRKLRRRLSSKAIGRTTVGYFIKGRRICRSAFAAVVQLSCKIIERHALSVATSPVPDVFVTRRADSTRGRQGIQKIIVNAFLKQYAAAHVLECPRGRGSRMEAPLRLLPSDTTKVEIHSLYEESWREILDGMLSLTSHLNTPAAPISYNLYLRYWPEMPPTLRIALNGRDFCDTCTTLKNSMSTLETLDPRYRSGKAFLECYRKEAREEFAFYKTCQRKAQTTEVNDVRHLVFDLAEKILLLRLRRKPGQLHFITGLKFDIFGVSLSNLSTNFIFGLTEGHWPNEKTANVVIPMLHHVLQYLKESGLPTEHSRVLQLHADNCSGQNKNRLFYGIQNGG